MRIVALDKESKQSILNDLLKRSPNNYSQYESTVNQIIEKIRSQGDQALFDYTLQFDKFALTAENIRVTREEIEAAYAQMDAGLIDVIRQSAENIRAFHQKQLRNSWFDARPDGRCRTSVPDADRGHGGNRHTGDLLLDRGIIPEKR